jgi:hypothetical protein
VATLWDRIIGDNLEDNPAVGHTKIAIHSFWGMISEWDRGYETQANVLAAFEIQAGEQTAQAASIKSHINAAINKTEFIRICKDWSYVGETTDPTAPETTKYHDWTEFETRMGNAVVDQGGVDPTP